MSSIEVKNQAELDAALKALRPGQIITCVGDGHFSIGGSATVRASGSATVRAWGSATVRAWDSATVEAWGSATVRASDSATVEASDSATVEASGSATVEAWGSATVRAWGSATVRAWDSATVEASGSATVEAWGSATVRASGSATVEASAYVAVTVDRGEGSKAKVTGGVLIEIPAIDSREAWLDYHGVDVDADGAVTLYKAVDADWSTDYSREAGIAYTPGTAEIVAADWDGGVAECGGGLHACAHPWVARSKFRPQATRFVAVRVLVSDLRAPLATDGDHYKIKARRVFDVRACDIDGKVQA